MSDENVIVAKAVSKRYLLYDRPEDRLKHALFWRFGRSYGRAFWALKDVTLEVPRGESVGILGKNGSGKSTLLQIIAGTLQATSGYVETRGRVAALLELGSGFNPEYTGRENVYMNGAILGISQSAMEERFDAIAAFADIGEFLEQPIKTYSSGMIVRLAFAVQAHVDPDVLIVDEALAVGDAHFQHKCMRHIRTLLDRGTTLLLVSHATDTIKRFCSTGLWLDRGEVRYYGKSGIAAEKYLAFVRMEEDGRTVEGLTFSDSEPVALAETTRDLELLVEKAGAIDMRDRELVVRGNWEIAEYGPGGSDYALPVVSTTDPNGVLGFRFNGRSLSLNLVCGPDSGWARVLIDGEERILDLRQTEHQEVRHFRFEFVDAYHSILLQPHSTGGPLARLTLIGANIVDAAPLPFRIDEQLDRLADGSDNEVGRYGSRKARIRSVELLDFSTLETIHEAAFGQRVRLRIHAERLEPIGPRPEFAFIVRDRNRIDLFGTTTQDEGIRLDPNASRFSVEFAFDLDLAPGSYSIHVAFVECSEDLQHKLPLDSIDLAYVFTVRFNAGRPVWYMFHQPIAVRGHAQ